MKKVLIAIDYNPCAQKIAETGYIYAEAMNADVVIIHAITDIAYYNLEYKPIMGFAGFNPLGSYSNREEQRREANKFLAAVVQHLGDKNIKTRVLDGMTAKAILEYADEWNADLIVIGEQSHNGCEKPLLGEVAANVLKQSKIPLLLVPTGKLGLSLFNHDKKMFLEI